MKGNIILITAAIFIISIIITLNLFFQQNYQAEMAEQFNKQQFLLSDTISKNIEGSILHLKTEMAGISRLLKNKDLGVSAEDIISDAIGKIKEEFAVEFKIFNGRSGLSRSSRSIPLSRGDLILIEQSKKVKEVMVIEDVEGKSLKFIAAIQGAGAWRGAILLDVKIDSINKKFVAPIKSGSKGYAWMMDSTGTLLYHPTQPEMEGKNLYKADASCFKCHKSFEVEKKILESSAAGVQTYIAPFGEDKIIAFSRINISPQSFWIACVSVPYSEVTASIRKSMRLHSILILAIFGTTAISAFTIVLINRKRVKAEEKARHEAELERYALEKLASLGRLTAGIAHEIGNPLTSVFSFLQILRERETDDFKKESLDTILFHINRIAEIVRQLSGLTKVPSPEFREADVNDLIETSLGLIQYDKRAKDISVQKELSGLPPVVTDANQLSQVFVNLILNAVDAMSYGGTLTIKSRTSEGNILVEFEDTGIGISKDNLQRIFDPFFTTKDRGTGLGLSVSYGIMERLGGDISVESKIGKGTKFTIIIPARKHGTEG